MKSISLRTCLKNDQHSLWTCLQLTSTVYEHAFNWPEQFANMPLNDQHSSLTSLHIDQGSLRTCLQSTSTVYEHASNRPAQFTNMPPLNQHSLRTCCQLTSTIYEHVSNWWPAQFTNMSQNDQHSLQMSLHIDQGSLRKCLRWPLSGYRGTTKATFTRGPGDSKPVTLLAPGGGGKALQHWANDDNDDDGDFVLLYSTFMYT